MTGSRRSPESSRGSNEPLRPFSEQGAPLAGELSRGLLDEVIRQTESMSQETSAADQADLEALLAVARRYAGQPLTLDPILVELVQAMLVRQFERQASQVDWRGISLKVAQTLFDDPQAQTKLHRLWKGLTQRVS